MEITLTWTDNSDNEDAFEIQRSIDGATWATIATVPAEDETYTDGGLEQNTLYYYRVRAVNSVGESDWSNTDSATTGTETPPTTYPLQYSLSSDRSSPSALQGATLEGTVYIFVEPVTSGPVTFSLDGTQYQVETSSPWDFAGTAGDTSANPFDTSSLTEGVHTITAVWPEGSFQASFTVTNVVVPPGDGYPSISADFEATTSNWQSVLQSAGSGDVILFRNGSYTGTMTGRLSGGQTLIAESPYGVVFDGNDNSDPWLRSMPNGIKIFGFEVTDYMSRSSWVHGLPAVIEADGASNCEIGFCEVSYGVSKGINWGPDWYVHDVYIHHFDEYAMHGGGQSGTKLLKNAVWEWCGLLPDREALADSDRGGCKFAVTAGIVLDGLTVRNCRNGVWFDIRNLNGTIRNFTIEDCERYGIFLELNYDQGFLVENGIFRRCGDRKYNSEPASYPQPAALGIINTPRTTVTGVTVEDSRNGIVASHSNRRWQTTDPTRAGLNDILVTNCHVRGIWDSQGAAFGMTGSPDCADSGTYAGQCQPTPDATFRDCTYDSGSLRNNGYVTFDNVVKV